jgi:hypothetical protein
MKTKRNYLLIISLLILNINIASAKKVKFAVDMNNVIVSTYGVYVSGDFQVAAGYASDFCVTCTPLTQEGISGIYSTVLDIPAFRKYEYKFLNGDQFYEAEFVPVESRVGYDFNDNRWIYVDSLADDTTFVGAIIFGGNAPAGFSLVRFLVNMQDESVSSSGVHVAGDFQNWDPAKTILYSFGSGVYEIINYVTAGNLEYKFYNGNYNGSVENVPVNCSVNNSRGFTVPHDTVLETVCFSACSACIGTGISQLEKGKESGLYPNPSNEFSTLRFNDVAISHTVILKDMTGRTVRSYKDYSNSELLIEKGNLSSGIYSVNILSKENNTLLKLIIE